jgi:hypothetical protein
VLCIGEYGVLLFLCFPGGLLCQFGRQAAQLPYADYIDKDTARGENRDAFHPPLFLPRPGKYRPDLRRLKWIGWMCSKLIAFLDNPRVKFHYCPLQRQVLYIVSRQPGTPALAETASVGHQSGRPQRLRHNPVPVFLRSGQLCEQPLTAVHDKLKILNDRRLISENPR